MPLFSLNMYVLVNVNIFFMKNMLLFMPSQFDSVYRASACKLKHPGFNSGHMPQLQA